jgi:poly(A) polymerase
MGESNPAISGFLEQVDPDALKVVRKLLAEGHEAYLVGGCVRDLYLGRRPKDFDVATSATPEAIRRLFKNSRIIGRRFKLAHVFYGPKVIETSTFRRAPAESGEGDLLITHDNEWGTVEDDARRRDFTINGLFFDIEARRIVDFVDGLDDLDSGIVRTIGDPVVRFQEDPVRMIRAVKFAARLHFRIEERTWQALLDVAPDIVKCSRARLLEEVYKLLRSGAAHSCLRLLLEADLLHLVMPSWTELFGKAEAGAAALRAGLRDPGADTPAAHAWRYFAALDDYIVKTGDDVVNGVLQAVLFAPLIDDAAASTRQGLDKAIERLMTPVGGALGIARRDRELARQILMAHHRMVDVRPRKRRRTSLAQRQYFHDALVFLGIAVAAEGGDHRELEKWRLLAEPRDDAPGSGGGGGNGEPDGKRPRRRRRRGGRKRRKGEGGADDPAPGESAAPEA